MVEAILPMFKAIGACLEELQRESHDQRAILFELAKRVGQLKLAVETIRSPQ